MSQVQNIYTINNCKCESYFPVYRKNIFLLLKTVLREVKLVAATVGILSIIILTNIFPAIFCWSLGAFQQLSQGTCLTI